MSSPPEIANIIENIKGVIEKKIRSVEELLKGVRIIMTLNMTTSISYVQFINRELFLSM